MTATDRTALILSVVRANERLHFVNWDALLELASAELAVDHGLCVTPEEIARCVSQSASLNYVGRDAIVSDPDSSKWALDFKLSHSPGRPAGSAGKAPGRLAGQDGGCVSQP
jgi:hypothetical protein